MSSCAAGQFWDPLRVGTGHEYTPVESTFEAEDAEAKFHADRYGVPIERAVEIANWQEEAQQLLTEIPELTDIYADSRLVHGGRPGVEDLLPGEIRVEVKTTNISDPDLLGLVESIESIQVGEFSADVVLFQVPRSLAELDALAAELMAGLPPGSVAIEYDFDRGEVHLSPAPTPRPIPPADRFYRVPWVLVGQADNRLELAVMVIGADCQRFDREDVTESGGQVEVQAWVERLRHEADGCFLVRGYDQVVVTLSAPLDDRSLTGCMIEVSPPHEDRESCAEMVDL